MGNNNHIPSDEIRKDIRDTEIEIDQMQREEEGLRLMGGRWDMMRADSRRDGIKERKAFIEKLEAILKERGE